jgi:patatin-like phospholipase/acyl hydrolase
MRILTFDGGGIRGVLSARLMERLEEARPGFIASVDFFAGTSIGSINAALLAHGVAPETITEFFKTRAARAFGPRDFVDRITHLDELMRANYGVEHIATALTELLGDTTLGQLDKFIMIPAFDLDNQDQESKTHATRVYKERFWKPKFMHNFGEDNENADREILVKDACLRSSAAPTYFPSYQGYIDGGMMDNNPSMSALAKAAKITGQITEHTLLSMGTGFNPHYIPGSENDWGYKQWLLGTEVEGKEIGTGALLTVMFDGMLGVPDYQCRQLLNGNYRRLDCVLPVPIDLADSDRLDDLIDIADAIDISPTLAWIDTKWGEANT